MEIFCQIGVAVFGTLSVWFLSRKERWKKWGYLFGLLGEPFWLWTAIVHRQWGIVFLVAVYTYCWIKGVKNHIWDERIRGIKI